jgi:hypothetical protein
VQPSGGLHRGDAHGVLRNTVVVGAAPMSSVGLFSTLTRMAPELDSK